MRIGIDLRSLQTGSQYRGIGYYTYNLVKAMCKIDKTNEYIFFANERADDEKYPLLDSLVVETVKELIHFPTTRIQDRTWKRMWERNSTPLFFRIANLDILHVTSLFESELAIGLPSCGSKLILTLYDLIPLIFKEFYLDCAPEDWRLEYLESVESIKKNVDGIIAISECTKRDAMQSLGSPEKKIEVVYGGISDTFFIQNNIELIENVLRKFNIDGSFILFTAAEDFRKNFDTLIKAFAILITEYNCHHKLVIIGRSSEEWRTQLLSQARILGIEESSLKFTGFVTDEELNLLYNAADIFVFPSLYEGFGLPILEAMSCRVPVIAANNSSIPEVCGDAALLIEAKDYKGIAQKIYEVLSNPILRKDLKEKGLKNVERFSWDRAARKVLAFYERIANVY